ncbi:hypothetical protein EASAB2608_04923 [Streptomyces sp. EAS-AB2608]|uniref:Secreted protein n=1 Tax=Streptomyces bangladeshensis TaxID=295352 RepID=A0ABN3BKA1_9ACTN|nr:hypothetical protein EASAB2608_04923 [Streptomyces sp. EAS-AB2608]
MLTGVVAGGVVLWSRAVAVAVADAGSCVAVAGPPVVAGGAEVVEAGSGGAVSDGVKDGADGGVLVDRDGDGDGVLLGVGPGLVIGRGGAVGRSPVWPCGHRNSPRPSPATARTEPAVRRAARTRRRARTPARSASRCRASKGAGCRSCCMSCVSCRSK